MEKNKNSKSKAKFMMALAIIIFIILAITFVGLKISEKNNVFTTNENVSGDNENVSGERKIVYQRLNEEDFKIDTEKNEITFDDNIDVGSFCISENPEGPTEEDKWIVTNGEKTVKLEELSSEDNETKKTYIYYLASNFSSMTNYDSSKNIYTISNETELEMFASKVNSGTTFSGKTVYLINDITLSGTSNNHTPIGTSYDYSFQGTFDGNGYVISNLQIDIAGGYFVGLFGYVSNNANLKNIIVKNGKVTGAVYVGAVVGCAIDDCIIEQCHNQGVNVEATEKGAGRNSRFCRMDE